MDGRVALKEIIPSIAALPGAIRHALFLLSICTLRLINPGHETGRKIRARADVSIGGRVIIIQCRGHALHA